MNYKYNNGYKNNLHLNYSRWERTKILLKNIVHYGRRKTPSRILCDEYLKRIMPELYGEVIELGGRKRFEYSKFAHNASHYIVTNIESDKDYDEYADNLELPYKDNSIDNFVAIALLEHINHPQKALGEVQRCLKSGGKVLLIVPAMYPRNPSPEEFFRFSPSALIMMLDKCNILNLSCHGGLFTLNALAFRKRHLRPIGIIMYLLDAFFGGSEMDKDYPHLIGVLAEKK